MRAIGGTGDWLDDGYYPARDEWPGGHRYGVRRERNPRAYSWSAEDRALAARHDIELPTGLGLVTVETWWDQPRRTMVTLNTESIEPIAGMSADAVTETTASYSQAVRDARQYACHEWDFDPLRSVRPIRVVAVAGSPLRAVAAS